MNFRLDRSALVFVSLFAVAACRGEDPGDGTNATSGGATTTTGDTADDTTGDPLPTTTVEPTTTGQGDTTTTGVATTPPDTTNSFITTNTTTEDPTNDGPLPNGSMCASDDDCESMNCYSVPIPGIPAFCADCNEDQDCVDAGTGISCSIDLFAMNAACAPGVEGNNCEGDEACMDPLVCAPVIETGGLLPLDTCGECADSSMCMNGDLCTPVLMGLGGSNQCVAPGSVMNGGLCPDDPVEGDMACMSGICANVSVMGFLNVPVCGECEDDSDCMMGQTCMPGAIDVMGGGLTGSTCVDP